VVLEQIRRPQVVAAITSVKDNWARQGADVTNIRPDWLPEFGRQVAEDLAGRMMKPDSRQMNNMGTTMTIALQHGRQLWFIHCGDSDGKLIRNRDVIFNTRGHSMEYQMRLEATETARQEHKETYRRHGRNFDLLSAEDLIQFEAEVKGIVDGRFEILRDYFEAHKNVVSSVLGMFPTHVHINNAVSGAKPLEVEEGDIVWVSSDGITVPVCDHEIPMVILDDCGGDLKQAREIFITMAEARHSDGENPVKCQCGTRCGKDDDKTVTLRYARGEGGK
jgi:serine/threonine protein phosphatase PrpC